MEVVLEGTQAEFPSYVCLDCQHHAVYQWPSDSSIIIISPITHVAC